MVKFMNTVSLKVYTVLRASLLRPLTSSNSIQNEQKVSHVRVCQVCMCVHVRRRGGGERAAPRLFLTWIFFFLPPVGSPPFLRLSFSFVCRDHVWCSGLRLTLGPWATAAFSSFWMDRSAVES